MSAPARVKVTFSVGLTRHQKAVKHGSTHKRVLQRVIKVLKEAIPNAHKYPQFFNSVSIEPYNEATRVMRDTTFTIHPAPPWALATFWVSSESVPSDGLFTLIIDCTKSLAQQAPMIRQFLPAPTGAPSFVALHFSAFSGVSLDDLPAGQYVNLDVAAVQYTQEGCSIYQFLYEGVWFRILLWDDLNIIDALKSFKTLSKHRHKSVKCSAIDETGGLTPVKLDKATKLRDYHSLRFLVSQSDRGPFPVVFMYGGQASVLQFTAGKSKIRDLPEAASNEYSIWHGAAGLRAKVAFRRDKVYLQDDFDLQQLGTSERINVDILPDPFHVEIDPRFQIEPARAAALLARAFDPKDRLPVSRIKQEIRDALQLHIQFELVIVDKALEDTKLLADYTNPTGAKLRIWKDIPVKPVGRYASAAPMRPSGGSGLAPSRPSNAFVRDLQAPQSAAIRPALPRSLTPSNFSPADDPDLVPTGPSDLSSPLAPAIGPDVSPQNPATGQEGNLERSAQFRDLQPSPLAIPDVCREGDDEYHKRPQDAPGDAIAVAVQLDERVGILGLEADAQTDAAPEAAPQGPPVQTRTAPPAPPPQRFPATSRPSTVLPRSSLAGARLSTAVSQQSRASLPEPPPVPSPSPGNSQGLPSGLHLSHVLPQSTGIAVQQPCSASPQSPAVPSPSPPVPPPLPANSQRLSTVLQPSSALPRSTGIAVQPPSSASPQSPAVPSPSPPVPPPLPANSQRLSTVLQPSSALPRSTGIAVQPPSSASPQSPAVPSPSPAALSQSPAAPQPSRGPSPAFLLPPRATPAFSRSGPIPSYKLSAPTKLLNAVEFAPLTPTPPFEASDLPPARPALLDAALDSLLPQGQIVAPPPLVPALSVDSPPQKPMTAGFGPSGRAQSSARSPKPVGCSPSPPTGRFPTVFPMSNGASGANRKVTIMFALRQHEDVPLDFGPQQTVFDAKTRLAERYRLAPDDIVLLHQGKALGDTLILSRLRLREGMKIHLFLKQTPEIVLKSPTAMRFDLALNDTFKFRNLATGKEITLQIEAAADVEFGRKCVAQAVGVADDRLVTILNGTIVVDDIAVLSEIDPADGVFGFTINSPEVGAFAELQRKYLDDNEMRTFNALGEKIIQQLAPSDWQWIQGLKTDREDQYEAAALFLRANRQRGAVLARDAFQ